MLLNDEIPYIDAQSIREDVYTLQANEPVDDGLRLGHTFGELLNLDLPSREEIILGLGRREVGIINAKTNIGKTTLLRNLMLSLSAGRSFFPFRTKASPQRVAFLDFEDTLVYLREDLVHMTRGFSAQERENINNNILLICDGTDPEGRDLTLTCGAHIELITKRLEAFSPALLIIDTIGAAFSIKNENDNAEVRDFIMKPLRRLAKNTNAIVLASHHIGKGGAEDRHVRDSVFRGRGASAFSDMARTVLNIEHDSINDEVILRCPKIKGPKQIDLKMRLNSETRWFEPRDESQSTTRSTVVLKIFEDGSIYQTRQIVEKLANEFSERTVKRLLNEAISRGEIRKVRRGHYGLNIKEPKGKNVGPICQT